LPPKQISITQFLWKGLAGLTGGTAGTIVLLIIFLLGSSVFRTAFNPDQTETVTALNPLFIFAYIIMIFIGSITANIVSALLISFSDKSKYRRINSTIYQVFIANTLLFIITAPVYIITMGIDLSFVAYVTSLHVILSIFATGLILEIIAEAQYSLLSLYSVILAILISTILNLLIYRITNNSVTLLFVGLPVLWTSMGLSLGGANLVYNFIANTYGIDFLSPTLNYGKDDFTEAEVQEEERHKLEVEERQAKMQETGAEFLEKNEKEKKL